MMFNNEVKIPSEKRAMMAAILAAGNDGRGGDSWGYYTPTGGLQKGLGEITTVAHKLIKENVYFAHTRKATHGGVSIPNAHPFEIGNITGAHNGIIMSHSYLNNKYNRNFAVDSMHLFAHLNEDKDFGEIDGYGAIEWIDKRHPGKIFLCRMSGGDLSISGIGSGPDDVKGVIWSSDGDHLSAALTAAGVKHFEYKVENGVVYYIEKGKLWVDKDRKLELSKVQRSYTPDWRHGYSSSAWREEPDDNYEKMVTAMMEDSTSEAIDAWAMEEAIREEMFDKINEHFKTDASNQSKVTKVAETGDCDEMYDRTTKQWVKLDRNGKPEINK